MVEQDTVKLLRECDAGVKMGVASIDGVLEYVHDERLMKELTDCKKDHASLQDDINEKLADFHDDGKDPSPMAKGMSWMKINTKLVMNESDGTIADLITDGCNMGVKSLSRYLNQYGAADQESKTICKRLIKMEEDLAVGLRDFL